MANLGQQMENIFVLEREGPFYSEEEARCFLEERGYSPTGEDNLGEYISSQVFTTYYQVARRINNLLGLGLKPDDQRMSALARYVRYLVEEVETCDETERRGLGCCVIWTRPTHWDEAADWNLFAKKWNLPDIGLQEVAVIRVQESKIQKGGFRVLYSPQYKNTEDPKTGAIIYGISPWKEGPKKK